MNDRYTSPETSRLLAEAGLPEPKEFDTVRCDADECRRICGAGEVHELNEADCVDPCYRALDLTDVLHELTRPRPEEKDARPLCVQVRLWHRATGGGWSSWCEAWNDKGESVLSDDFSGVHDEWSSIEAAAAVLLALLKERK